MMRFDLPGDVGRERELVAGVWFPRPDRRQSDRRAVLTFTEGEEPMMDRPKRWPLCSHGNGCANYVENDLDL